MVTGVAGFPLPSQINQHRHCIQPHHIFLGPMHLDCTLHVVRGGIGITPEDVAEILAATAHDQVGCFLRTITDCDLGIFDGYSEACSKGKSR